MSAALVRRLRELADEWERDAGRGLGSLSDAVVDLRATLDSTTPEPCEHGVARDECPVHRAVRGA